MEDGSETRMMVPESRKKLERFLRDQVKEMEDFVNETNENRFIEMSKDSEDEEEMQVEDIEVEDIEVEDIEVEDIEVEDVSDGEGSEFPVEDVTDSD